MSQLNLHRGPLQKSYRCPGSTDRYTHTSSKVIWHKLPESHHFLPHCEHDLRLIPLTGSWTSNKISQEPDAPIYPPSGPLRRLTMQIHTGGRVIPANTVMHIYATAGADMRKGSPAQVLSDERKCNLAYRKEIMWSFNMKTSQFLLHLRGVVILQNGMWTFEENHLKMIISAQASRRKVHIILTILKTTLWLH